MNTPDGIVVATFTEAGEHPFNEGAFLVEQHPSDPDCWLCFLADGQGGRAAGGEAARLACRAGLDRAVQAKPGLLAGGHTWASLLRISDFAVSADVTAGYTTLVGFCLYNGVIAGASSGDSAVLVVSGGEVRELTASQRKNPPVGTTLVEFIPFAPDRSGLAGCAGTSHQLAVCRDLWSLRWDQPPTGSVQGPLVGMVPLVE